MAGLRSFLYSLARLLGDVNAVAKGKVGRSVARSAHHVHGEAASDASNVRWRIPTPAYRQGH